MEADAVLLAPEAHQAARLAPLLDPALALLLEGIAYASSATVTLAYRRADIAHPLDGFGFVVPRVEKRPIIACTFSSVKYPGRAPDGHALRACSSAVRSTRRSSTRATTAWPRPRATSSRDLARRGEAPL